MINLYDTAHRLDGMVLSTDNYTEYLLGFWTLHGDVGDYGMLQNLWKTEVYGLANYLSHKYKKEGRLAESDSLRACIMAMPTDGLGISGSDFDQIYPNYNKTHMPVEVYGEVDAILLGYLNGAKYYDDHKVIQRYKATAFKRLNPFSIPRGYIVG
jgi:NH3-dependent NAD+ synthetase